MVIDTHTEKAVIRSYFVCQSLEFVSLCFGCIKPKIMFNSFYQVMVKIEKGICGGTIISRLKYYLLIILKKKYFKKELVLENNVV